MKTIPTGQVTFLFTDVEGSTRLSQEFPEALQVSLEKHHSIMQNAIESNNGFVFEIIGDAFCCAFENPNDAVKAAVDVQTKLTNEKWNEAEIKVRVGIHNGQAEWGGKTYMGYITLARTARVMSSAWGEQIIISNNVYELVRDKFEAIDQKDISFRDLGERRLKDVIQPIKLFQIVFPGLRKEFPPLKTLDTRPNNIPVQLTSFIGREKEMSSVKNLLKDRRLVTLLGPGGTGKTRLSLQIAADMIDDFENGAWMIELASLSDPSLLIQAVTDSLGVKEQPGLLPESALIDHIKNKELLLIFDNCEHVIDACALLAKKLLENSPRLKIISTSRSALRCDGEMVYKVLPLEHPDPEKKVTPKELSQFEAVRLFIERALAMNSQFRLNEENCQSVARICYQLDGIPLAIELAAVRIKILSPENICNKLEDRFRLLTGGKRTALPRQQTLRALIDWSYDLLTEKEKILWRRLSVFAGGWTIESAEEICAGGAIESGDVLDLINELTEKSIIVFLESRDKFKMLETIRQYGEGLLNEAGESADLRTRHLKYYLNLCEPAIKEFSGPNAKLWLDKIEEFYQNVQSALGWSVESNMPEDGNRLAVSMGKFWELRGYYTEGRNWFEKLLRDEKNISPEIAANSKSVAGILAIQQGQYEVSEKFIKAALEIYRATGNKNGIANSLNHLGLNAHDTGNYSEAKVYLNESLELRKEINNKIGMCSTLNSLGLVFLMEGDYMHAKKNLEESLEIAVELKDLMYMGIAYSNLAQIYDALGDEDKTKEYFEKSLQLDRELGNKNGISVSLYNIGVISLNNKEYVSARQMFEECLKIGTETGHCFVMVYALSGIGQTCLGEGDLSGAEKTFKDVLQRQEELKDLKCSVISMMGIAEIKNIEGKNELAATLLSAARTKYETAGAFIEKNLQEQYDAVLNSLTEKIGKEKADEAVKEGKEISFEKAIEMAINS